MSRSLSVVCLLMSSLTSSFNILKFHLSDKHNPTHFIVFDATEFLLNEFAALIKMIASFKSLLV